MPRMVQVQKESPKPVQGYHESAVLAEMEKQQVWDGTFLYTFENFFHPYVGVLIEQLNKRYLVGDIFEPAIQGKSEAYFQKHYRLTISRPTIIENIAVNNESSLLAYNTSDGTAIIFRIDRQGLGVSEIWRGGLSPGWTHIEEIWPGTTSYVVFYNASSGAVSVCQAKGAGEDMVETWDGSWPAGGTILRRFHNFDGTEYLLLYKGNDGTAIIYNVGAGQSLAEVWRGNWSAGMSSITPIYNVVYGKLGLLFYNGSNGLAVIYQVGADAHTLMSCGGATGLRA